MCMNCIHPDHVDLGEHLRRRGLWPAHQEVLEVVRGSVKDGTDVWALDSENSYQLGGYGVWRMTNLIFDTESPRPSEMFVVEWDFGDKVLQLYLTGNPKDWVRAALAFTGIRFPYDDETYEGGILIPSSLVDIDPEKADDGELLDFVCHILWQLQEEGSIGDGVFYLVDAAEEEGREYSAAWHKVTAREIEYELSEPQGARPAPPDAVLH